MKIQLAKFKDGKTTQAPNAQEIFDKLLRPEMNAALTARLANQYVPPMNPHTRCLHCREINKTDLPVCPECLAIGVTPSYKIVKCLICETSMRLDWDTAPLPLCCENPHCKKQTEILLARVQQSPLRAAA